jgi:hypothetical protein
VRQRELGPITQLIATAITIAILTGYGLALKWGFDSGNWWWIFPLGIAATVWGYFLVTDRAEREQGNREMAENFRRWGRAIGWGRRQ